MSLAVFNTMGNRKEPFVPLVPGKVGMYVCGVTVYDLCHIGHARANVAFDIIVRYLRYSGYEVTYVRNFTDIDDKINEMGITVADLAEKFIAEYYEDADALGIKRATVNPRATHEIDEIIKIVSTLIEKGHAYEMNGDVYFSVQSFPEYGKLSKQSIEELQSGARIEVDERKSDPLDFALWKASKPGEPFWESPWGKGRPGWHIECSAMSMKLLGPSFDLHLGGEDLMFPHHEDEIAQSEGAALQPPGRPFVKYWLHGAHLLVEGRKMSKSLGNFFTLRDLLARGFTGREIRHLLLTAHYRETFNFTLEGLQAARAALARIDECLLKLRAAAGAAPAAGEAPLVEAFTQALDDDLNISGAWGAVFEWVRDTNRKLAENALDAPAAAAALAAWNRVDSVLGVGAPPEVDVPAEITQLVEARQAARQAKDFKRADALREELKARGWTIEDTPRGARAKRL